MDIDVTGRPWAEAEGLLQAENIKYEVELARPTKDFFLRDEAKLYVIRQKPAADGCWRLTLAAKLRREVS